MPIVNKPISSNDYQNLGNQINLVGVDTLQLKKDSTNKYSSPRLLNWVEPYEINGVNKSLFYTEVNSNIQVGDRVFIVNGYYDSDNLIKINKYKSGSDGYKVLYVDSCKIVLDINYSGELPYKDDILDNFIKVYKVSTRDEFISVNRQISSSGGSLNYKFDKYQNNIVFIDSSDTSLFGPVYTEIGTPINGVTISYHIAGYGVSLGVTGNPGFYVRNGVQYWENISKEFIYYGNYDIASSTYSNNRIKIMNGDFSYNGFDFKEGFIYEWYDGSWIVDKSYSQPIITKSNFRSGNFNGIFNNGIFGTQEKRISWSGGDSSVWSGGTILNAIWEGGNIDSQITITNSYQSTFDSNNKPYQKANSFNNGGYGYNYIIDSYLNKSTIQNGNIINSKIGNSVTNDVLSNHLNSITQTFDNNIIMAYFDSCEFSSIYINNSTLVNSKINNTKVVNSKVINSQVFDSVIKDSTFISENSINIVAYDEWNISEYRYTNLLNNLTGSSTYSIIQLSNNYIDTPDSRTSHKLYKFYLDENDFSKLKMGDFFYLKGIKINNNTKDVLNFFDRKFKLGSWTEFLDDYKSNSFYKRGVEFISYLSTPEENSYILNSSTQSVDLNFITDYTSTIQIGQVNKTVQYTNLVSNNPNSKYYSIDIIVSIQDILDRTTDIPNLNFNYDSIAGTPSYLGNKIDITNAFVINSNFESGIFETSDWVSGYNINYSNDVNISSLTQSNNLSIVLDQISNTLKININQYSNNPETYFNEDEIVYLNSVDYIVGGNITRMPDTYTVVSFSSNILTLVELNTNIISSLTTGGYFTTNNSRNRYNYLSKLKFEKSKIESGIFKGSYFSKSLIQNSNYDSTDKDYNNLTKIKELVIKESIFSSNNNILSSATYLNSFFISGSDIWQDGIIQNSFLNGITFSKGTVKESTWNNGTFNGGTFYNSRTFDGTSSTLYPNYNSNRLKSYYMDGLTSDTQSNNRYSWINGTFNGGEFYKSDWENGLFTGGLFNYSKFYNGTFSGGNIGNSKNSITDTIIYNGDINYTTVDGATLYSNCPDLSGSSSTINWYDGVFNNGVFASDINSKSIWYGGRFNGGQFIDFAKWKNGTFNGGKFISSYGWTQSGLYFNNSSDISNYSWEDGIFNDGQFGNGSLGSNSTWYNGTFNGGDFKGRLWNNGIFTYGNFYGSSTYSATGGLNISNYTSNASLFVNSYTQNFYGLWVDGVVTKNKDNYIKNVKFYTTDNKISKTYNTTNFSNILWLSGTFSNEKAVMNNSVWLSGTFNKGTFQNSSFNPYVKRGLSGNYSFTPDLNPNVINPIDLSVWYNGDLIESDFYLSKWYGGNFISGTSYGMVFLDGVSQFMNAYNVIWEGGTWKNGNWRGSDFEFTNGFTNADGSGNSLLYNIVRRGLTNYGVESDNYNNLHIWNLFENSDNSLFEVSSKNATNISFDLYVEDNTASSINFNPLDPNILNNSGAVSTPNIPNNNIPPSYNTNNNTQSS